MKKILSLVLSLCLLMGVCTLGVSAETVPSPSENETLLSLTGETVPDSFKETIEETGVEVDDDTVIEVVSTTATSPTTRTAQPEEATVLVVKNQVGSEVEMNMIIPGTEDGLGFQRAYSPVTNYVNYYNDFLKSSLFNIRVIAIYDKITGGPVTYLFRPKSAHFIYTEKGSNVDLRYVDMRYYCMGALWTYPEFNDVSNGQYEHIINVTKSYPTESVRYGVTNALASNRCIYTLVGPTHSHSISIDVTVGSQVYSTAYSIPVTYS